MSKLSEISVRTQKLFDLYKVKYEKANHHNPSVAAEFAVKDTMNMFKTQMHHIEQLLDDEIEYLQTH
jgi:hypothetical protein